MKIAALRVRLALAFALAASVSPLLRAEDDAAAAKSALRGVLATETSWTRVHAAEVLVAFGEKAVVRAAYLPELALHGDVPRDRIGIHRVLARSASDDAARRAEVAWISRIAEDPAAPDRLHATEALAKLGGPHDPAVLVALRSWLPQAPEDQAIFPQWVLWQSGDESARRFIVGRLRSTVLGARTRAAYVLRTAGTNDPAELAELARAAEAEPADSAGRCTLVSAAYQLHAAPARQEAWRAILEHLAADGTPSVRYEALQALMPSFSAADLPRLRLLMASSQGDVRTAAAWAILTIVSR